MRFTRVLTALGLALGLALGATLATVSSASALPASRPASSLYFVSGGYISRVPAGGGSPVHLVRVGGLSVTGMTIADGRLYYATLDNGKVSYVPLSGGAAHTLVSGLAFPVGLVSADGWLYWADQNAIGRVRPDGASLTRRFVALPQETGGGVANGLATNGRELFFSRCQNGEIGEVAATGGGLNPRFIRLPGLACPQQLAVGNTHLYWTELGGHIGRATLSGGGANDAWLNIRNGQGPFNVAADGAGVYWDWGGVAGAPMHVGMATVSGTQLRSAFLTGQGAFFLTAPGANT
jgi:hypothetical protein